MVQKRASLVLFLTLIWLPRPLVNVARIMAVALLLLIATPRHLSSAFAHLSAADIYLRDASIARAQNQGERAPNCMEFIVNGGFEQTSVGWRPTAGASLFTYAEDQFVSGQQSLLLGFTAPLNITATFGVEQLVTLPAESNRIEFAFYYEMESEGDVSPGDQAYLTMVDAANNQLLAMLVLSPPSSNSGGRWSMGRYDLTPLAGKSMRVAFIVENDGEPGRLAMRVDDVSILACLPPESFALEALPTPTPTLAPPVIEPLILSPPISPTVVTPPNPLPASPQITPAIPQETPLAPQTQSAFPQPGSVTSLDACNCGSSLYACTDFSNWSVAQACYTRCQVTAGYDIHNLDPDRNGIACELELQDVAPLEATPSPQPTPSVITQTNSISPGAPPGAQGAVTTTGASTQTTVVTTGTTPGTTPGTTAVAMTVAISPSTISTAAIAAVPVPTVVEANALNVPVNAETPASALTPLEMLSLLLFSPLGFIAIGALLVIGGLSLWVAYMLGQRGQSERKQPTNPNVPEDFTLQPKSEVSTPKS